MQTLFELLLKPKGTVHGMRVDPAAVKRLLTLVVGNKNKKWKVSLSRCLIVGYKSLRTMWIKSLNIMLYE